MNLSLRGLLLCGLWIAFVCGANSGCIDILGGSECQSNADCISVRGQGWVCLQLGSAARKCTTTGSTRACNFDVDCKTNEFCVGKTCRVQNVCQCEADSECAKNFSCINCRCTTPSTSPCKTDKDCASTNPGFVCSGGDCVAKPPIPSKCTGDQDCREGDVCVNEACVLYTCALGKQCPAGYMCLKAACVKAPPPPPSGCKSDLDCQGDVPICNIVSTKCVQCITDSDCSGSENCSLNICKKSTPCECRNDTECKQNQKCNKCICVQGDGPKVVQEGDVCDLTDPAPGTNKRICTSVFKCIRLTNADESARCVRPCREDKPEDCGHNEKLTCIALVDGESYCVEQGCTSNADCSFSGVSCVSYLGKKVCLP